MEVFRCLLWHAAALPSPKSEYASIRLLCYTQFADAMHTATDVGGCTSVVVPLHVTCLTPSHVLSSPSLPRTA